MVAIKVSSVELSLSVLQISHDNLSSLACGLVSVLLDFSWVILVY